MVVRYKVDAIVRQKVDGKTTLQLGVYPPLTLSYSTNPAVYDKDVTITPNVPTVTGGDPTGYTVSPALPTGLTLDPVTGIISGTPTVEISSTGYTVTASNGGGSTSCSLSIAVAAANSFTFTIAAGSRGAGLTFTLPLGTSPSYTHDFTVDWGDSSTSTITAYNDPDRIHTYATAGTYTVTLRGTCEYFAFNNGGSKLAMWTLVSMAGNMGFKVLNFYGCIGLTTVVALGNLTALTTAVSMFDSCVALTAIPAHIFDGCPAITSFQYAFYGCNHVVQALDGDIFRYNVLANNYNATFYACAGLTGHGWGDASAPNTIMYWPTQPGHAALVSNAQCFRNCTALDSYSSIPVAWR